MKEAREGQGRQQHPSGLQQRQAGRDSLQLSLAAACAAEQCGGGPPLPLRLLITRERRLAEIRTRCMPHVHSSRPGNPAASRRPHGLRSGRALGAGGGGAAARRRLQQAHRLLRGGLRDGQQLGGQHDLRRGGQWSGPDGSDERTGGRVRVAQATHHAVGGAGGCPLKLARQCRKAASRMPVRHLFLYHTSRPPCPQCRRWSRRPAGGRPPRPPWRPSRRSARRRPPPAWVWAWAKWCE